MPTTNDMPEAISRHLSFLGRPAPKRAVRLAPPKCERCKRNPREVRATCIGAPDCTLAVCSRCADSLNALGTYWSVTR